MIINVIEFKNEGQRRRETLSKRIGVSPREILAWETLLEIPTSEELKRFRKALESFGEV